MSRTLSKQLDYRGPHSPVRDRHYFDVGAGAVAAGVSVELSAGVSAFFFLSVKRVLSPAVVAAFFFFLAEVSPANPNGPACALLVGNLSRTRRHRSHRIGLCGSFGLDPGLLFLFGARAEARLLRRLAACLQRVDRLRSGVSRMIHCAGILGCRRRRLRQGLGRSLTQTDLFLLARLHGRGIRTWTLALLGRCGGPELHPRQV